MQRARVILLFVYKARGGQRAGQEILWVQSGVHAGVKLAENMGASPSLSSVLRLTVTGSRFSARVTPESGRLWTGPPPRTAFLTFISRQR